MNCKEFKIKFRDNQTLSRHIQTKHEEVTYACEKCDYQTHRKDTLREHIHIKHLKTKITCSSCNFEGNRRAVSDHKLVAHKGKIFHCSYCDYQAKTDTILIGVVDEFQKWASRGSNESFLV